MVGLAVAGAATAAAGVASSSMQADAAGDAADKQAGAANRSADIQRQQYTQTREDLFPYAQGGRNIFANTADRLGDWEKTSEDAYRSLQGYVPVQADYRPTITTDANTTRLSQADLEATPGYQFTLNQGLRAAQNAAAARGLGVSGASLKAAADYATGLSDSTYNTRFNQLLAGQSQAFGQQQQIFSDLNQQFQNEQTRFADQNQLFANRNLLTTNAYNRMLAISQLGENAAAQTGTAGTAAAQAQGNALVGAGNAQAAGTVAQGNALGSGISGAGNSLLNAYYSDKLLNNGQGFSGLFGSGNTSGMTTATGGLY